MSICVREDVEVEELASVLPLASLKADLDYQLRDVPEGVIPEAVQQYAAVLEDGGELPPILVYQVGPDLVPVDGWQRLAAHQLAGRNEIAAVVREGTRADALLAAAGANARHGVPRTAADRRKAARAVWERVPESHDWKQARWAAVLDVTTRYVRTLFKDGVLGDPAPPREKRPSLAKDAHPAVRDEVESAEGQLDEDEAVAGSPDGTALKVVEDDGPAEMTEADRLHASLPAWSRQLAGKPRQLMDREVALYLALREHLEALTRQYRHARGAVGKVWDGTKTVLEYEVDRLLAQCHPRERRFCLECNGHGCQRCKFRGYS